VVARRTAYGAVPATTSTTNPPGRQLGPWVTRASGRDGSSIAAAGAAVATAAPKSRRTKFPTMTPETVTRDVLADAARFWTAPRWMVLMLAPPDRSTAVRTG
jgi:hypothetical protein